MACALIGAMVCVLTGSVGADEVAPVVSQEDAAVQKSSPKTTDGGIVSGRAVGEVVPSFYTRAVTGPMMNRSVCYVCRNGNRPVVMVFVRKFSPGVSPLFRQVDRLVDEYRAEGLRGFAVHVSENPSAAISEVQTFAFDHKIGLPMTVSTLAIADPESQNLHEDAEVTVVLYEKCRVTSRRAFRAGELLPADIETLAESVRELVRKSETRDQ